jgi:GNAT superfamily N-acetyltransferase
MTIRTAGPDDADTLASLNAHVQQLHVDSRPDYFRPTHLPEVARWFRDRLGDPRVDAWLLEEGDGPVACALVVRHERRATPFTRARLAHEIDQLGVHPDARGRGLARALVTHVRAHARLAGASEVTLRTWAFNAEAVAAFHRLGFRTAVISLAIPAAE